MLQDSLSYSHTTSTIDTKSQPKNGTEHGPIVHQETEPTLKYLRKLRTSAHTP